MLYAIWRNVAMEELLVQTMESALFPTLKNLSEENIDVILKTVAVFADVMEEKYICDDVY